MLAAAVDLTRESDGLGWVDLPASAELARRLGIGCDQLAMTQLWLARSSPRLMMRRRLIAATRMFRPA